VCGAGSVPYAVGPEKDVDSVSDLSIVGLSRMVVFAGYGVALSSSHSWRDLTSAVDTELFEGTAVTG
jgi:hypothetical protein